MKLESDKLEKILVNIGALSMFCFCLGVEIFKFPDLTFEHRILGILFVFLSAGIFIWSLKGSRPKTFGANKNIQLQEMPPAIIETDKKV